MRIPTAHRRSLAFDQTTMTPLIDIVFQLLIFFVCASTGHLREFLLPTDLAAGGTPTEIPQHVEAPISHVWIRLHRDGDLTITEIEGTPYRPEDNMSGLLRQLAQAAEDAPLILEIDGEVPMGDAISVFDQCKGAGFKSIQFAADAKRDTRKSEDR